MRERSKLVRLGLSSLILKRVGIHTIKTQLVRRRLLAQCAVVRNLVPRDMWRNSWRGARKLVDHTAILQLFMNAARLAGTGKASKPCAPCAHTPGGNGHRISHGANGHCFDINAASLQLAGQCRVIFVMRGHRFCVLSGDEIC